MNTLSVGHRLVINGCLDMFFVAIPFMNTGGMRMAIEEFCRGLTICREEYPREYARYLLRFLGLERKGYPTGHWAGANSILNRRCR